MRPKTGRSRRSWSSSPCCRCVLSGLAAALVVHRRRRRRRPSPTADAGEPVADLGHPSPSPTASRHRAAVAGAGRVLLPGARAGPPCEAATSARRSTVPLDYARPERPAPSSSRCCGCRPATRTTASARSWSTPAVPARPAPTTANDAESYFGDPLRDRSTSSASTRAAPATPTPSTASPTTSSTPTSRSDPAPDDAAEDAGVRRGAGRLLRGLRRELRRPGRPRLHRSRPPATWTCCAPRSARRRSATSASPTAPRWARPTPSCSPTRSAGSCSTAPSTRPSTFRRERAQPGRRLRDRAARPTCRTASTAATASSATPCRRRLATDQPACSTTSTTEPLPTDDERDLADRQRLLRAGPPALQRVQLAGPRPGPPAGARRRRHHAAAALGRLRLARGRRRLRRQQPRGDLRHQLPRRPRLRSRPTQVADELPDVREGVTDLRRGLRLGPGRAATASSSSRQRAPPDDRRRGRRPDRRRRHHPRPRHAVRGGGGAGRPARVRRPAQPRRRRPHRPTTRATPASTTRSRTTSSTAPCRTTARVLTKQLEGAVTSRGLMAPNRLGHRPPRRTRRFRRAAPVPYTSAGCPERLAEPDGSAALAQSVERFTRNE